MHYRDMVADQQGTNKYLTEEYAKLYEAYQELKELIRESPSSS